MDQALLQALEGFLIGAIPTIIFIFLLFLAYRSLVHTPLQKVLHERYERTEGAVVKAQADIAAAAAKTSEYEQRLREARQAVFKVQEARRQTLAQSREAALKQTRMRAQQMVLEARGTLEVEVREAKTRLQQDAENLAAEVIRMILKPVGAAPVGGRS
jgi:F-type H+-transporting ATPase subunit b